MLKPRNDIKVSFPCMLKINLRVIANANSHCRPKKETQHWKTS